MSLLLDLKGQTTLIAGASSGIRLFAARLSAKRRSGAARAAWRMDRLETVAAEMSAAAGATLTFPLNVAKVSTIDPALDLVEFSLEAISKRRPLSG